jgi:hypothetical protein
VTPRSTDALKERIFVSPRQASSQRLEMMECPSRLALDDRQPVQDESVAVGRRQLAVHAEVKQAKGSICVKEDVSRVSVSMKETVR